MIGVKRIRISSSIANFRERLRERYSDYVGWTPLSRDPCLFFGAYHWGDVLRIFFYPGPKTVFFCGSDILSLSPLRAWLLKNCRHVCENSVEHYELGLRGIYAQIQPMLFDDPEKYQITYKPHEQPTVWMTYHKGREQEYGLDRFVYVCHKAGVQGFAYHSLGREHFDKATEDHDATLRFNKFDGFSENLAKALLRGQYAYSVIPYPDVEQITDDASLIESLKKLKDKTEPNVSRYWREELSRRVEA